MIRKFNLLHCGERGLFIPLALGQGFPNCPLPTHLQLTLSRFLGKITRWEVYKSDLLTYSGGVQIRPSHIFTFYSHVYNRRRIQQPSGTSGSLSHEGSMIEHPAVIFAPGGDLFYRRYWPSSLCFRVAVCHLCLPMVVTEGLALRPFASERRFVSFTYPKVVTEGLGL